MSFKLNLNDLARGTLTALMLLLCMVVVSQGQTNQTKRPNIVVIMTDDVGIWNISAYHRGMMGRPHSQH
jgi:hypothetical protein